MYEYINTLFLDRTLQYGDSVLVKPNIVSREPYPTTTDPEVVAWVLGALHENGSHITVADGPAPDKVYVTQDQQKDRARLSIEQFYREFKSKLVAADDFPDDLRVNIETLARSIIVESEIADHCKRLGIGVSSIYDSLGFVKKQHQGVEIRLADTCGFDAIINLPVLKLHSHCGYSGSLKNLYGLLYHFDKALLHYYAGQGKFNFLQFLDQLPALVGTPIISLTDASRVPSSQERVWGASCTYELCDEIWAGDAHEVNRKEFQKLKGKSLLRNHSYSHMR